MPHRTVLVDTPYRTVLVVDDDPAIVDLRATALRK